MPPTYDQLQVEGAGVASMSRTSKRIAIIVGSIILGCVFIIVLAISVPNSSNNKGSSKETPYNAFSNSSFMGPGPVDGIPCIEGNVKPAGCKQRFVKCGSTSQVGVKDTIPPATDTACKSAKFYNAKRECLEVKMAMGECWGPHPNNPGSTYSCQGKCGAGCGNINCGAWARDCLRHDVCSWYYTATGGGNDAHCGEAYNLASDDFFGNCACNASGGKDKSLIDRCP